MRYELRSIRNEMIDAGPVRDVIRRGDALYARTNDGESFPVTGSGLACSGTDRLVAGRIDPSRRSFADNARRLQRAGVLS